MIRSRVNRRNTMDCAILNEMFVEDDSSKYVDKRSKQLLRESERDLKRASMITAGVPLNSGVVEATNSQLLLDERAESFPAISVSSGKNTLNQLVSEFWSPD